jgi:hypothetical protein
VAGASVLFGLGPGAGDGERSRKYHAATATMTTPIAAKARRFELIVMFHSGLTRGNERDELACGSRSRLAAAAG